MCTYSKIQSKYSGTKLVNHQGTYLTNQFASSSNITDLVAQESYKRITLYIMVLTQSSTDPNYITDTRGIIPGVWRLRFDKTQSVSLTTLRYKNVLFLITSAPRNETLIGNKANNIGTY